MVNCHLIDQGTEYEPIHQQKVFIRSLARDVDHASWNDLRWVSDGHRQGYGRLLEGRLARGADAADCHICAVYEEFGPRCIF
jgi:hypothetical protein